MRKIVLLRWSVGAVGAGSVPGGALGGARFGVLRAGEGRVPSRGHVGRGKVPVAGQRGVGVGRRLVGRRRAGRRRAGRRRAGRGRGVGQQPPPWPVHHPSQAVSLMSTQKEVAEMFCPSWVTKFTRFPDNVSRPYVQALPEVPLRCHATQGQHLEPTQDVRRCRALPPC